MQRMYSRICMHNSSTVFGQGPSAGRQPAFVLTAPHGPALAPFDADFFAAVLWRSFFLAAISDPPRYDE
jgi:hypothetical protein